jgi:hypothetical protein
MHCFEYDLSNKHEDHIIPRRSHPPAYLIPVQQFSSSQVGASHSEGLRPNVVHGTVCEADYIEVSHRRAATRGPAVHLPRHSLHEYLILPCGQMALPPHSLHWLLCLPCGQMALPPHSLHWRFRLPCGQMPLPPHSLHRFLILPCGQMPLPQHSSKFALALLPSVLALLRSFPVTFVAGGRRAALP